MIHTDIQYTAKSLISLQICENPPTDFEVPVISWCRQNRPNLVTFTFDTFSDPQMLEYAIGLFKASQSCVLWIEGDWNANERIPLRFIQSLLRDKGKLVVIVQHQWALLKRLFAHLPEEICCQEQEFEKRLAFLKLHL